MCTLCVLSVSFQFIVIECCYKLCILLYVCANYKPTSFRYTSKCQTIATGALVLGCVGDMGRDGVHTSGRTHPPAL